MGMRPLRRAGLALLVSAVALSGLGLSATLYACPMDPEPSAQPCCPDTGDEPAPAHSISATPCCQATHVDVAPAATDRLTAPDARPVIAAVAIAVIAPPPVRPLTALLAHRPAAAHGPPPLERTTRLLI